MIVRMTFLGVVKSPSGKNKGFRDHIDIHVGSIDDAKKVWKAWSAKLKDYGVRGASGIFHPLGVYGELKVESFEEAPEDEE